MGRRIVPISQQVLTQVLKLLGDMPKDAVCLAAHVEQQREEIWLKCESDLWPELQEGAVMPKVDVKIDSSRILILDEIT